MRKSDVPDAGFDDGFTRSTRSIAPLPLNFSDKSLPTSYMQLHQDPLLLAQIPPSTFAGILGIFLLHSFVLPLILPSKARLHIGENGRGSVPSLIGLD